MTRDLHQGWEFRESGELFSMIRWGAADWEMSQFMSVRRKPEEEAVLARSHSSVLSVETVYDWGRPVSQRFVTREYFIVTPTVMQVGRVWNSGSFAKAMEHYHLFSSDVLGLLDAQEELAAAGGHQVMLAGVL